MKGTIGVILLVSFTSACSFMSYEQERITSEVAEVELQESAEAYFVRVVVRSQHGDTVVTGRTLSCASCAGHINVSVIGTDGQALVEIEVANNRRHPRKPTEREWAGWFRAKFPFEMESGMHILLKYHDGVRRGADCGVGRRDEPLSVR